MDPGPAPANGKPPGLLLVRPGLPAAGKVALEVAPAAGLFDAPPGSGLRSKSLRVSLKQSSLHGTGGAAGMTSDAAAVPGRDEAFAPSLPSVSVLGLLPAPPIPFPSAALLLAADFDCGAAAVAAAVPVADFVTDGCELPGATGLLPALAPVSFFAGAAAVGDFAAAVAPAGPALPFWPVLASSATAASPMCEAGESTACGGGGGFVGSPSNSTSLGSTLITCSRYGRGILSGFP